MAKDVNVEVIFCVSMFVVVDQFGEVFITSEVVLTAKCVEIVGSNDVSSVTRDAVVGFLFVVGLKIFVVSKVFTLVVGITESIKNINKISTNSYRNKYHNAPMS